MKLPSVGDVTVVRTPCTLQYVCTHLIIAVMWQWQLGRDCHAVAMAMVSVDVVKVMMSQMLFQSFMLFQAVMGSLTPGNRKYE